VLARPPPGVRTWTVMRVERTADSTLVLSAERGERQNVPTRDVVPLEH